MPLRGGAHILPALTRSPPIAAARRGSAGAASERLTAEAGGIWQRRRYIGVFRPPRVFGSERARSGNSFQAPLPAITPCAPSAPCSGHSLEGQFSPPGMRSLPWRSNFRGLRSARSQPAKMRPRIRCRPGPPSSRRSATSAAKALPACRGCHETESIHEQSRLHRTILGVRLVAVTGM